MKSSTLIAVAAAIATSTYSIAAAETASIGASKDTTLYEFPTGDLGNGKGSHFFAGRTAQSQFSIRRGLLAFDIASIVPAGSTITDVTLQLHMSKTPTGATAQSLHRTLANWGEGNSDDSGEEGNGTGAQVGDATWLHTFYFNSFWDNEGGDFAAGASATSIVAGIGFYTWSGQGLIDDVQMWLDSPSSNFGWTMLGDESAIRTVKRYDTRENSNAARRPMLTVTYIPTPGTLALVGFGAAIFARRRRASDRR